MSPMINPPQTVRIQTTREKIMLKDNTIRAFRDQDFCLPLMMKMLPAIGGPNKPPRPVNALAVW